MARIPCLAEIIQAERAGGEQRGNVHIAADLGRSEATAIQANGISHSSAAAAISSVGRESR